METREVYDIFVEPNQWVVGGFLATIAYDSEDEMIRDLESKGAEILNDCEECTHVAYTAINVSNYNDEGVYVAITREDDGIFGVKKHSFDL